MISETKYGCPQGSVLKRLIWNVLRSETHCGITSESSRRSDNSMELAEETECIEEGNQHDDTVRDKDANSEDR